MISRFQKMLYIAQRNNDFVRMYKICFYTAYRQRAEQHTTAYPLSVHNCPTPLNITKSLKNDYKILEKTLKNRD